ncbi:MAG: response regulator [Vicinamibacteria bacterium]|nr:response regulator [Vicinamibacteria bacterium]
MGQLDRHILLVDDEEGILTTIRSFLGRRGYQVDCAHDPAEARRFLLSSRYELVITDLCLTSSRTNEGLEIVGLVRKHHPETRVVLLTGYGSPELEVQAIAHGADAFLDKRIRLSDIARTVDELLDVTPPAAGQGG